MVLKLYLRYMSPPCRSVLTVAKALNLELAHIVVDDEFMSGDEVYKLNPQRTVPILEDDDFVVFDSNAINAYLVSQYAEDDALYPKDPKKRAIVDERLHFHGSVLHPRFLEALMPIFLGMTTQVTDKCFEKLDQTCEILNTFLEGRAWLAGDEFTIGDAGILCSITALELAIPIDADKFPNLADWLQRGKELDFFKEANEESLQMMGDAIAEKLGL